jgi:fructoselysine 6-kinase
MSRVATIGDNCIDEYVAPVAKSAVGGSALNVALHLRRAGHEVAYVGAVGDDSAGRRILGFLDEAGVGRDLVRVVDEGHTAVTRIHLREGGEREFLSEDFGVGANYSPTEDELARLGDVEHAHLTVVGLADWRPVAAALARAGVAVSCDFRTSRETDNIDAVSIAFYSASRAEAEELGARARAGGVDTVVVTCGRDGSLGADAQGSAWVDARTVEPVDTCGAGDSYIATFIDRRLAGASLDDAMNAATEAASRTCLHLAAFPQELNELESQGVER